jgi:hypothetical protein
VADRIALATVLDQTLPGKSLMTSDTGEETTAGVPALVARLVGTVKQELAVAELSVNVAVRWQLFDENDPNARPRASGVEFDDGGTWTALPSDAPLERAATTTPAQFALKFPAMFSELTSAVPSVMKYSLQASVKLSVQTPAVSTDWVDLPAVPLVIPTIPIPTVLAMFENPGYTGRALVCVPSGSLVGSTGDGAISLKDAFALTTSAAHSLLGAALAEPLKSFLGFLAGPIGSKVAALTAAPGGVIFAARSRIDNLSDKDFEFDPGWFNFLGWRFGWVTAEDLMDSFVCVGREGAEFNFFLYRNLNETGATRLQFTLGNQLGIALINTENPDPTDHVEYGGAVTSWSLHYAYANNTSSLEFSGPTARFVEVV